VKRALAGIAAASFVLVCATTATSAAQADTACTVGSVQFTATMPTALGALQASQVSTLSTGAGILVAVVDSGVDANNPHLAGVVVGGVNLVPDGGSPMSDVDGHGTAIAGEIAARRVAGSGVIGLAPEAQLLSVRVFRGTDDESVRDGFGPTSDRLAAGIVWAADNGAKIINVSLSDVGDSSALRSAVDDATAHGALVVASAGNRATATDKTDGERYPAGYPGALGVTASNTVGVVTNDSIHGPQVGVAAPGMDVLTTATGAGDCMYASDAASSSFATGYVSGAAALVAEAHPDETPAEWAYRLEATALRSNPDARDDTAGWGVIQPYDALTLLPSAATRGPSSPFVNSSKSAVKVATTRVGAADSQPPLEGTLALLAVVIAVGLTLLGTLGAIIVLRRRPSTATIAQDRLGLLDRPGSR
jgi:membrane-anchored mycosin MYCP